MNDMKHCWFVLLFLMASSVFAQQSSVPEIKFRSVPDFLKLPPNMYLGEVTGVAVNSKGNIFILSRGNTTGPAFAAAATQLLEFGPDGHYIREIGHNLYAWSFGHTVRVDKQDNIWVTDKGSNMIVKFNPEGRVVMVFGRKQEAADDGTGPLKRLDPPLPPVDGMFRQVTDVAWNAEGDTFISDGYINSRVGKVDKNGRWLMSWGEPGEREGQFHTPHSIATDAAGNVYVADRGNARIQVFDGNGKFLRIIKIDVPFDPSAQPAIGNKPKLPLAPPNMTSAPGSPWAICITPGPNQVLFSADSYPGRVYKLNLDGKVLGYLGESGKQLKQFGWIHEIACPSANEIIVGELLNWRAQKLILEPTK
jgi:DNA-binding beta-propeller fold protein YncE